MITANVNNKIFNFELVGFGKILTYHATSDRLYIICSETGIVLQRLETYGNPFSYNQFMLNAKALYYDLIHSEPTVFNQLILN